MSFKPENNSPEKVQQVLDLEKSLDKIVDWIISFDPFHSHKKLKAIVKIITIILAFYSIIDLIDHRILTDPFEQAMISERDADIRSNNGERGTKKMVELDTPWFLGRRFLWVIDWNPPEPTFEINIEYSASVKLIPGNSSQSK